MTLLPAWYDLLNPPSEDAAFPEHLEAARRRAIDRFPVGHPFDVWGPSPLQEAGVQTAADYVDANVAGWSVGAGNVGGDVRKAMLDAFRRIAEFAELQTLAGYPVVQTVHVGPPGVPRTGYMEGREREDELTALRRQVEWQAAMLHDLLGDRPGYTSGFAAGASAAREAAAKLLASEGKEGLPCSEADFHEAALRSGPNAAFAAAIRALPINPEGQP